MLAIAVLVVTALWVLTGEFSRLGGHADATTNAATAEEPGSDADAGQPQAQSVLVATSELVPYARPIRVSGITEPDKTSVLAARAGGVIGDLPAVDGLSVSAGDVVVVLNGLDKIAAVATGKSLVVQRASEAKVADSLLARGKGAQLSSDTAHANLAAAKAQLEAAQSEVDNLTVLAPYDGVVDDVAVERGSWVQAGAEIATLLALDPIVVRAEIGERDRAAVEPGASVKVRLADGSEHTGTLRYVRRQASGGTRTFAIKVDIPNHDGAIPAGMTAEVEIQSAPVPVAFVPRSVVTLGNDGSIGVRVVSAADVAEFVPVTISDDTPRGLALAGIPAGARIIVSGQDLVKDGDKVVPVAAEVAAGHAPRPAPAAGEATQ